MILDLVVIGILLVSAVVAFMRGVVRELLTIGALGGAGIACFLFGPMLAPYMNGWLVDPDAEKPQALFGLISYEMLAPVVAYTVVFVGVFFVLTIITHLVSQGVHAVGLGPIDRSLGVVFGLVRGVVIIGLLSMIIQFVFKDEQRELYFKDSQTYPYVSYLSELTGALLPDRDVLNHIKGHGDDKTGNKDNSDKIKKAIENARGGTGSERLEPGQAHPKRTGSAGYTGAGRARMDRLVVNPESADGQNITEHNYNFNN